MLSFKPTFSLVTEGGLKIQKADCRISCQFVSVLSAEHHRADQSGKNYHAHLEEQCVVQAVRGVAQFLGSKAKKG